MGLLSSGRGRVRLSGEKGKCKCRLDIMWS